MSDFAARLVFPFAILTMFIPRAAAMSLSGLGGAKAPLIVGADSEADLKDLQVSLVTRFFFYCPSR